MGALGEPGGHTAADGAAEEVEEVEAVLGSALVVLKAAVVSAEAASVVDSESAVASAAAASAASVGRSNGCGACMHPRITLSSLSRYLLTVV